MASFTVGSLLHEEVEHRNGKNICYKKKCLAFHKCGEKRQGKVDSNLELFNSTKSSRVHILNPPIISKWNICKHGHKTKHKQLAIQDKCCREMCTILTPLVSLDTRRKDATTFMLDYTVTPICAFLCISLGILISIEYLPCIILGNVDGRTDVDGGSTTGKGGKGRER